MTLTVNPVNNSFNNYRTSNFKRQNKDNQKVSVATKIAASTGSAIGVVSSVALIANKKGLSLKNIKNIEVLIDTFKKLEFNAKDVIAIASSSILGGFLGGAVTDKKNTKAKAKEGIIQLVGNYIVPSLSVGAGIKLNRCLNKKYNFPPVTKPIQFAFGFVSLIGGVLFGNSISKSINKKIFKEENYRNLTWKDWAVQFDNVCLVTSMSSQGTQLAKMASKVIPVAHLFPGYLVGVKKEG